MSKPWEQEWRVDEEGIEDGVFDVVDNDKDLVATVYAPFGRSAEGIQEKRTRLLAAAPYMARALMGLLVDNPHPRSKVVERHTPACWDAIYAYLLDGECGNAECAVSRAALRKAGVPL